MSVLCLFVFLCVSQHPFLHPLARFVSAQQILLTGFLEDGSVEQNFEIKERCCLAEGSEAMILGWGNGTCDSSEAPEAESCVGGNQLAYLQPCA